MSIPRGPDFARDPQDKFRLVTHGSLLERYGIQTLIEAVGLLRDSIPSLELEIIGLGEFEPQLQAQVSDLGLGDRIHFSGVVYFEHIAARLIQADLGVVPLWIDGMPNKLMEYLLLGIPTIASDFPSLRLYFGDDAVCYVPAKDPKRLAAAIQALYDDPPRREALGQEGRRRYFETLAWRKARRDYLNVYAAGGDPEDETERPNQANLGSKSTWLSFVLGQSRGPRNAITRLPTIVNRFGLTARKSQSHLEALLAVTDRHSVRPTLPVTAVTARRNPYVLEWLRDRGVELAAHGYVHNDYATIPRGEQFEQVKLAREQLDELGFHVDGWRCPYSRWNGDTLDALRATGFRYDATPVYAWPAFEQEDVTMSDEARADYRRLCTLFNVRDAGSMAVLPSTEGGLLRIPMSIPQDEDMVDRLHLDPATMARVWLRVLKDSRDHGETFVICLHPERAVLCNSPLDATLAEARSFGDVWLATLGDIASWWLKRAPTKVSVKEEGAGRWLVTSEAAASVVTRHGSIELDGSGSAVVEQTKKPVVAYGSAWTSATIDRIQEAGFLTERAESPNGHYAVNLDSLAHPSSPPDKTIRALQGLQETLIRVAPWPKGFRSCVSVTGDIDALTLFDFAMRLKEF